MILMFLILMGKLISAFAEVLVLSRFRTRKVGILNGISVRLVQSQSENDLNMVSLSILKNLHALGPSYHVRSTFSKTNRMSSQSYMKGGKEGQEVKFYVRTATDKAGTTE